MQRDIKVIKLFMLLSIMLLSGCSSLVGKVSMSQLERDIPQEIKEVLVGSEKVYLDIDSMEINRRSTEGIYDEIYCDIVMSNEEYQLIAVYVCEYKHYSEGGWILENCWLQDANIVCLAEMPSQIEWVLEDSIIYLNGDEFDVLTVESSYEGDNVYEIVYNVMMKDEDNEFMKRNGVYKIRYSLIPSSSRCYVWEIEEDATGVLTTWDIVGTYEREKKNEYCKLVIDSYNPNTKEVHIVSYYHEIDSFTRYAKYNENDFTVTAEEGENSDNGLWLRFGFQADTIGMGGTHHDYQNIVFDGNGVSAGGIQVYRID